MLDARLAEAGFLHPALAVGAGVVESGRRFDQHVQAHHQAERVLRAVVVDDAFIDDQRAALGHGIVGFANQHALVVDSPIVQNVAHQNHVGLGQRLLEETAGDEAQAIGDAVLLDILLKDGPDLGQVEADPRQVGIGQRDLHRQIALRRADVGEGLVVAQGNFDAMAMFAPWLMPVIAARNDFRRAGSA